MKSWLEIPPQHDFSIYNIPFGIFYTEGNKNNARCGTILGDNVIDLSMLYELGYFSKFPELNKNFFEESSLNSFMALGNDVCFKVRRHIQSLFCEENNEIKLEHRSKIIFKKNEITNLLPIRVADYVDFYSNIEHATNVGKMFRDENNPLLPNWKYIPIGYHGRSSSIVVSGTSFKRPKGQIRPSDAEPPFYAPSRQLDFELEMAFITSGTTKLGETISPDEA
ncbi:MAG: fumarylacetoacetase, partial [Bdellovibrionota bacterium]